MTLAAEVINVPFSKPIVMRLVDEVEVLERNLDEG